MQVGPDIDHRRPDLSIYKIVRNRLPWVKDTPENKELISNYTLEVMYQLNSCFQIPGDKIGQEENYTIIMQTIIADVICIFFLMAVLSSSVTGGESTTEGGGESSQNTFLKTAKAGSVEVEYEQFDSSKSGGSDAYMSLKLKAPDLISLYKGDAMSKASSIGCYLNIFDDGTLSVGCAAKKPFYVVPYDPKRRRRF